MIKKKYIILVLVVLLWSTSCIEYTAKFFMNKDGSGKLDLTYIVQKTLLEHSALSRLHNNKFIPTSKKEVLSYYKNKPGVTLLETEIKDIDEVNKKIHLVLHFDKVSDMNDSSMKYYWGIKDNKYTFGIKIKSESVKPKNSGNKYTEEMVKKYMSRFHITFEAMLPRKIVDTNADETDWNTATWKISLYDMTNIKKNRYLYASMETKWWENIIEWFSNLFHKILSIFK